MIQGQAKRKEVECKSGRGLVRCRHLGLAARGIWMYSSSPAGLGYEPAGLNPRTLSCHHKQQQQ
uniref:Uncharacterized protein n=1 Tax=Salix viminalis TaxID=40686 RepID=A0A6N2N8L3_SALVM